MKKSKDSIRTGYFTDGLPYACIGNKPKILMNIKALSFSHEPPQGFMLKEFVSKSKIFLNDYTVYLIGRKPNLPEHYLMDKMSDDYATMIRREFGQPVDIMGVSTGGQIAHFLAADHPDVVRRLVIISAAYRLSEKGVEIERKAADFYKAKKYGQTVTTIMGLVIKNKFMRFLINILVMPFGKKIMGNLEYPNDFLAEVEADREMDFRDRLHEIKQPTLILSGKNDVAYTSEDVSLTAKGIENSKLVLYEGYGHDLTMFKWKDLEKEILEFLNSP